MAGERTLPGGKGLKAFWTPGSNGWNVDNDTNWRVVSVLLQGSVLSYTTELPGSGSLGDIYVVPSGANANDIAVWDGESGSEAWVYITPQEGWRMYAQDDGTEISFNGSAWGAASSGALADVATWTGFDPFVEYDFESGVAPASLTFVDDGGAYGDWFVTDVFTDTAEGKTQSLQSPDISHSQWTAVQLTVDADVATALRVRWNMMAQFNETRQVLIDDGLGGGFVSVFSSSDDLVWSRDEIDLSSYSGDIDVQLRYTKSVSGNSSYDSVFIAEIDLVKPFANDRGAVVEYRGRIWVSKVGDNSDTPGPASAKWKAIGFSQEFYEEITGTTYSTTSQDFTGGVVKEVNNAATVTITVEPDMAYAGNLSFVQTGDGGISFAAGAGVTIQSDAGKLAGAGKYTAQVLMPIGGNVFRLVGALA